MTYQYPHYLSAVVQGVKEKRKVLNVGSEEIPEITVDETHHALSQMKNNKALGKDNVITEMIKESGEVVLQKHLSTNF